MVYTGYISIEHGGAHDMGTKLRQHDFQLADYIEFEHALIDETALLNDWVRANYLSDHTKESGLELECWMLDQACLPVDANEIIIQAAQDPHVVTEIAKSTIEFNLDHHELHGNVLTVHRDNLSTLISRCKLLANKRENDIICIGALPTASLTAFSNEYLTNEHRYLAIDALMRKARDQQPICITIHSASDKLTLLTDSAAIGGVIAAFQIHYRVGLHDSRLAYNAAQIIAAPMLAIACNSPFLMGHELWMESRIPFMEQFFHVDMKRHRQHDTRALFGDAFIKSSMLELFAENLHSFTILIPQLSDPDLSKMSHLKIHNGTIYRWNRPVLDFDTHGKPHFRIETRMLPSGPTIIDMCANAAFFFGLMQYFILKQLHPAQTIPFDTVKRNFYLAARDGLQADLVWTNSHRIKARELILQHLIPMAREGLYSLDIDHADANSYLAVIEERVSKVRTGSDWQIQFYHQYGENLQVLTQRYQALQTKGDPVHEWPI